MNELNPMIVCQAKKPRIKRSGEIMITPNPIRKSFKTFISTLP